MNVLTVVLPVVFLGLAGTVFMVLLWDWMSDSPETAKILAETKDALAQIEGLLAQEQQAWCAGCDDLKTTARMSWTPQGTYRCLDCRGEHEMLRPIDYSEDENTDGEIDAETCYPHTHNVGFCRCYICAAARRPTRRPHAQRSDRPTTAVPADQPFRDWGA